MRHLDVYRILCYRSLRHSHIPLMPEDEIFTANEYRDVYPAGIERNFWNRARNKLVYQLLAPHLGEGDLVMDVGCGTGIVVNHLKSRGLNIRGVELGAAPLMAGLEHDIDTGTDLFELEETRKHKIKAILLLDVLEHIGDREKFLGRIHRELPNCTTLLITVPARMEIWSSYDEHWGHYLRYDRPTLAAELTSAGFVPRKILYFFHWVYLVSVVMKKLGIQKQTDFSPIKATGVNAFFHRFLGFISSIESKLVPNAFPGSTIACVAHRPSGSMARSID